MATITTIASGDNISNSRTDINTNFANLNSDKIETSVIDTDTALTANSDAKLPSQKAVKAYVDANITAPISVETTTGTTYSITTTGSQRVVVLAKGSVQQTLNGNSTTSVLLNYDGVQKDTVSTSGDTDGATGFDAFSLMYTEIPTAGTRNITLSITNGGSIVDAVIIVLKIRV
jgi:hypothetical protein